MNQDQPVYVRLASERMRRAVPDVTSILLADDGLVPNNALLPLRIYRTAFPTTIDTARLIARLAKNGWVGAWINGIYPFHHYHARAHEVLVIASGHAQVQFGGAAGPVLELAKGDGVLIPAGVGHCRRDASSDLVVVGAYPQGQEDYDLKRATAPNRMIALAEIGQVAKPEHDPILGGDTPWK